MQLRQIGLLNLGIEVSSRGTLCSASTLKTGRLSSKVLVFHQEYPDSAPGGDKFRGGFFFNCHLVHEQEFNCDCITLCEE